MFGHFVGLGLIGLTYMYMYVFMQVCFACHVMYHSHKKRKDSLETRAVLLIFSLELRISGVAVQGIH